MTEHGKLQAEIDKTARELEQRYKETMKKIEQMQDRSNELEQSRDGGSDDDTRLKALDSAAESLSIFSDSLVIESEKAWKTYHRLERECEANGLELTRLDEVQVSCKKTEVLASDLLCYTLGRLRHTRSQ